LPAACRAMPFIACFGLSIASPMRRCGMPSLSV
jgi:hypothetical protein